MIFKASIIVDKHISKKNNRPIWRGRLGKSKQLISAENYLIRELRNLWWSWGNDAKTPIDYPVNVKMTFYFKKDDYFTKKGNINKKIPDLSNLYQLVEDCLEDANILENDHYISGHDGSRRTFTTLDQSYLEIEITSL